MAVQTILADTLYREIPAGLGSTGAIRLNQSEMDAMLSGGAAWAVKQGHGSAADLDHIEEHGQMRGARPDCVSEHAKKRQRDEMGTLGSGNHYLEVQKVVKVFDTRAAEAFGIRENDVVVSIHCGSRGLGHQIGTEFLKEMVIAAPSYGITLPDRELACARRSIARWPTGKSLPISRARRLVKYFPRRNCRSSTMSRTTRAKSKSMN
jgi:tRNA-splicing ligase RtcB